jgi:iron complex outermembrane receptor protein
VPGYRTRTAYEVNPEGRVSETVVDTGLKRVWDAYALWIISPTLQLRLSGNNLHPIEFLTGRIQRGSTDPRFGDLRQEVLTANTSFINWRLQLEMKL